MIWLALIASAYASTASSIGLTPLGGGLAGINESGTLGLPSTPAAARSARMEVALDAGVNMYTFGAQLDGTAREETRNMVPMPYLGFTMPLGDFGIGAYTMVPYGGGADFSATGAMAVGDVEGTGRDQIVLSDGSGFRLISWSS